MKENILYKFLPCDYMINVLENLEFKCTKPDDYSDIHDSAFIIDESMDGVLNIPGQQIYFLETDSETALPKIDYKPEYNKWLAESRSLYKNISVFAIVVAPPMLDEESIKYFKEGVFSDYRRDKLTFCMTKEVKNRRMWDFYASGYKGIAIGINVDCDVFSDPTSKPMELEYTNEIQKMPISIAIWRKWLVKNKDYDYEKEFRSVFAEDKLIRRTINGKVMHFLKLPQTAISHIILGPKISKENEKKITEMYADKIKILRCNISKTSYDLEIG